jgi:hypothetical protein
MFDPAYIDPGSLYTVSTGLAAIVGFALSALAVVAVFFRRLWDFFRRHWVPVAIVLGVAVRCGRPCPARRQARGQERNGGERE